ncbi:unnamed protein product [Prunus armeniaca]
MPPRKKTRSNNITSQDGPSHADSESRQHASSREEERASEGTFTLTDLVAAIRAMGDTQREMAEMIKELKNSAPKPSEVNEKHPQEESAAAGKESEQKGPSFVTQEDVVAMLEKELSRSQEDWKYLPQPPYPSSLLQQPYPKGYEAPTFVLFDGRKGSPKEHVNRFIDALGPYACDHNLRLRVSPIVLTHGIQRWHQALFIPGKVWQAGSVRSISSMKNESPPLNSTTLAKSMVRIPWTLYAGSGTWHWIAMMRKTRKRLLKFASAISRQIIECIWRILALVNFLGCWKL